MSNIPSSVINVLIGTTARIFDKYGIPVSASKMSRTIRAGYNRDGIDGAVVALQTMVRTNAVGKAVRETERTIIHAFSLECKENPYVSRWYSQTQGGLVERR